MNAWVTDSGIPEGKITHRDREDVNKKEQSSGGLDLDALASSCRLRLKRTHVFTCHRFRALQRSRGGKFNLQALLHTGIVGSDLLLHTSGRPLRASDIPGLQAGNATVQDILELHWVNATTLNFRLRHLPYPYDAVDSFRLLCDSLVFSYPDLLLPHDPGHHLIEYGRSDDTWYLQRTAQHLCLFRLDQNNDTHEIGRTSSLYHAENLARSVSGRSSLKFVPHPLLHPVLPLWGAPRLHEKAALRVLVARTKRTKADQDLAHRRDLAHASSVVFGTALDCVSWDAIHRFQHSSSRQRLLYYRIKGHRLSGWDRLNDRRGCPHYVGIGSAGGSVFHTVWDCASAQNLWNILRTVFTSLGLWKERLATTNDDFLTAVFSLKLPCIPPKIWELPSLRKCRPDDDDTGDGPYPVLQAIWQQLVLETLVVIHAWRTNVIYAPRTWSTQQAEAVHNINCRRVLDTLQYRLDRDMDTPPYAASIISRFKTLLESPDDTTFHIAELTGPARALLFGGSPGGQPGPRGVGAFVVASSAAKPLPAVHWSSATWIAEPTTTQHQANYRGLIDGLRAAETNGWHGLTVIGDSALILRQLRDYKPPKNDALRRLYHTARRLADTIGVRHWRHQPRAHNTTVRALATHAMATEQSSTAHHPTGQACHADLPRLTLSDLQPWLANQVDPW